MKKKILFFDTETTGLDNKAHEMTQLAYILDIDGEPVIEQSLLMRPLKPETVTTEALEVQHRTMQEILSYPHPFTAYKQMVSDLEKHINKYDKKDKSFPCAYNCQFDIGFLIEWFLSMGDLYLFSYINKCFIDPMAITRFAESIDMAGINSFKLKDICSHLDINMKAHDALEDVRATRRLYYILVDRFKK